LKLIIEDQNIVEKINSNLTPQIRVWGLERTISSFSAYQRCDSRIYEYLIPTHCFLPPHPKSYLGARLGDLAEEANDLESFKSRQGEVSTFWDEVEVQHIKPILDKLDPSIVPLVLKALYESSDKLRSAIGSERVPEDGEEQIVGPTASALLPEERNSLEIEVDESMIDPARDAKSAQLGSEANVEKHDPSLNCGDHPVDVKCEDLQSKKALSPFEAAIKDIKNAYLIAKKSYRIDRYRLERVRSCLARFVGTHNYHNYTVHKTFGQNSSKRVIKSFDVASEPLLVNGTEWLSLKVHGQSFMMHQIRKMVAMVALIVRSGCPETRIDDSYTASRFIIPKAPGLGLLLERPVFDTYHPQTGQGKIEFVKYEAEMQEFKQREIYDRIFKEEETDNLFHIMCTGVDHLKTGELLYLSSMGEAAVTREGGTSRGVEIEFEGVFSEDEGSEEDS
jgi:tRNA pseudouridine38-40 synthase